MQRRKRSAGKAWRPPCKAISIGNITSGGSGKTPFCIYLAGLLRDMGVKAGISHRGYKGSFEHSPVLISDRDKILHGARESGDEAWLLANRLPGIPVVVGKDRRAAVSLLLESFPDIETVILDDSLQHLKIARDLDLVCFDAETGIGNGRLIPAGYLREPLSALDPGMMAVVNVKDDATDPSALEGLLSSFTPHLLHCEYRLSGCVNVDGMLVPAKELLGKRLMLISGIANPDSFEKTVRQSGLSWLHHFRYPDHYAFSEQAEIDKIAGLAMTYKAERLLCTEKDLAKLASHERLKDILLALRVGLCCPDPEPLTKLLKERLEL